MPNHPDTSVRIRYHDQMQNGARIKVVSVGGGGNNAINRMIDAGMEGVEFISANTDLQSLQTSKAQVRLQLGERLTRGLGAGANPEIGRRAALEASGKILEALEGADMVFITAGLGGGTGTGAAPVIAALASQMGALTVAIVTRPFGFEGKRRMSQAERGLKELLDHVDTLIVIPNEKLLAAAKNAGFFESFQIVDEVLQQAVRGISDIITIPGVINRDFADVRATMAGMGYGAMGTASRTGPGRAAEAALAAITSPLLEAGAIDGARGVLINITGSHSLKLSEVYEASTIIQGAAHEEANIIFGAVLDERLGDEVKITVIATGFHQVYRDRADTPYDMLRVEQPPIRFKDAPEEALYDPIPRVDSNLAQTMQEQSEPTKPELQAELLHEIDLPIPATYVPDVEDIDLQQVRPIYTDHAEPDEISPFVPNTGPEYSEVLFEDVQPVAYEEELLAYIDGPPFALSVALDRTSPIAVSEQAVQPEIARLRQTAMAAYSAISIIEDEDDDSEVSEATSFAAILASRGLVQPPGQTEADDFSDEDEMSAYPELLADSRQQPILPSSDQGQWEDEHAAEPAIAEAPRLLDTPTGGERSSISETSDPPTFKSFAPPLDEGVPLPSDAPANIAVENGTLNKPVRDFNHRLNRAPDFWPGREASGTRSDASTRVPSFAVAHDPDEPSAELDELDIPAFLRGRT